MTARGADPEGAGAAALDVDGRRVRLTNLDRVLWPRTGTTKGEMVDYYVRVAPALLPHLAERASMLWRFPEGVDGPNWFQTRCRGRPEWVRVAPTRSRTGEILEFCVIDDVPSLVWVANLGTIEIHPYLARADRPDRPTALVFDLDPGPPATLLDCARVALAVRDVLETWSLASFAKTSGGVGLHVYVPLNTPHTFDRTKDFARAVASMLAERDPDRVIDRMSKAERAGKVFVDWGQNDRTRSMIAAYSLYAADAPSVSTPVGWDEVERAVHGGDASALRFGPSGVLRRLDRDGDLFEPVLRRRQRLP